MASIEGESQLSRSSKRGAAAVVRTAKMSSGSHGMVVEVVQRESDTQPCIVGVNSVGREVLEGDRSRFSGNVRVRSRALVHPRLVMSGPDVDLRVAPGDQVAGHGQCQVLPPGVLPERLECRYRTLRADRILLEDLLRDLAADHLGRMRGSRRLRRDGFPWIGLPLGSEPSGTAKLRALGLSELLLRAREYERLRRGPSPAELGYWWLARARIWRALMDL